MEKIKTRDLRLAKVKYYDTAHNGAEISDLDAYAFMVCVGENQYVNLFDPNWDMAVFERSMYSNYTKEGVPYGNKLMHLSGTIMDGACYVLETTDVAQLLEKDSVTEEELKEFIFKSDKFFVDRLSLLEKSRLRDRIVNLSAIWSDTKKMNDFKRYIASHEHAKQYIK